MGLPLITIKKGRAKPFWQGHPLIFSGAIQSEPKGLGTADIVEVQDASGRRIGFGFYNPTSLYRVRLVAWANEFQDFPSLRGLIERRVSTAREMRRALGLPSQETTAYRLLNSEGDRVSGLTVDVYGDVAVVEASAAWVLRYKDDCLAALNSVLEGRLAFQLRTSRLVAPLEGLSEVPPQREPLKPVVILENGLKFLVDFTISQKTGFYLDQRENRLLVRRLAKGRRVLDAYCFTGAFAISAFAGGAAEVVAVDTSKPAIEIAKENAKINGIEGITFIEEDASEVFKSYVDYFDLIVCDPPRLAPSQRHMAAAARHYEKVLGLAIKALRPGGILVACSCSKVIGREKLLELIREASAKCGRHLVVFKIGGAAPDHPLDPAFPEGEYLTCIFSRLSP